MKKEEFVALGISEELAEKAAKDVLLKAIMEA